MWGEPSEPSQLWAGKLALRQRKSLGRRGLVGGVGFLCQAAVCILGTSGGKAALLTPPSLGPFAPLRQLTNQGARQPFATALNIKNIVGIYHLNVLNWQLLHILKLFC